MSATNAFMHTALRKDRAFNSIGIFYLIFILCSSSLACSPKAATPPSSSSSIRYGNIVGNLANDGLVAQQGDWIHYVNGLEDNKIYKIRIDGTQKQKVCDDHAGYLNVIDDWIYYVKGFDKLYKIRTDGTGDQLIGTTED